MNRITGLLFVAISLTLPMISHGGPEHWEAGQAISPSISNGSRSNQSSSPHCGLEISCSDRPIQLGHPEGVCFRATCPGVWALMCKRVDDASFRTRAVRYRHYSFKGSWELKDEGAIEAGHVPMRHLFLVLADDLIEFRLDEADPYAKVEVTNVGYLTKGSVQELQQWLAYHGHWQRLKTGGPSFP